MFEKLLPQILKKFELEYQEMYPAQTGYRNTCYKVLLTDGTVVNIIIYKNESGIVATIRRANEASQRAASAGLPARQQLSSRILTLRYGNTIRYVCVYNYLPGQTIPWEAYTKKHIKLLGQAMSDLHASLQSLQQTSNQKLVADDLAALCARMESYFADPSVQKALAKKMHLILRPNLFTYFQLLISAAAQMQPIQPLHMDFVRGNILFQKHVSSCQNKLFIKDTELSGILDFEKTAHGHVMFDIARTLAFLLVDCNKYPEKKIIKYFLQSGYNKRGNSNFKRPIACFKKSNVDILEQYITFFLLHDFYKFLKHNPYEFLDHNHHYVRTRDTLLTRNMVKYKQ